MFKTIMVTMDRLKLNFKKSVHFSSVCKTLVHIVNIFFIFCLASWGSVLLYNADKMTKSAMVLESVRLYAPFYLTNPTVVFQTLFLFLSLTHDGLEWSKKQNTPLAQKISYWRDVIFSGLVVPYTCFVFSMFWGIYSIDRELVFPAVYDEVVPWWFNQCVHSNILVLVLVETLLQARREPRDKKMELMLNAVCGILYAIVYYSIYFFANRWLYNVFSLFTWWQICIFQCCIWASSYIFYVIQFPINRMFHKEGQKISEDDSVKGTEKIEPGLKYRNVKEHSSL